MSGIILKMPGLPIVGAGSIVNYCLQGEGSGSPEWWGQYGRNKQKAFGSVETVNKLYLINNENAKL